MSVSAVLTMVMQRLDAEEVPYRVIGAAALAAHGVSRATQDLDLLVTDRRALAASTWEPFDLAGFELEVREGDREDPLAGVVRIDEAIADDQDWDTPLISVDIVVIDQPWAVAAVQRNGPAVVVEESRLESVSLEDLVLLKLYAGGPRDQSDLQELLERYPDLPQRDALTGGLRELPASCHRLWAQIVSRST